VHGLPTDVVNPSWIGVARTDARCVNPLHHYLTAGSELRAMSINASGIQSPQPARNDSAITVVSNRP